MKNLLIILFLGCFISIGCRDKKSSEATDNQSSAAIQEQTIELEKATEENQEIKKDIEQTVDELDALMKEIDN